MAGVVHQIDFLVTQYDDVVVAPELDNGWFFGDPIDVFSDAVVF